MLPIVCEVLCLSCYALICVHSSFAIILKRKRKLVALLLLSYRCIVTINVLCLILTVPRVGLQCVIVIFPDHTHLLFMAMFFLPFRWSHKTILHPLEVVLRVQGWSN